MSINYYLWKWNTPKHVSPGLCFLHLMRDWSHPNVSALDRSVTDEIDAEFAAEMKSDETTFQYSITKFYISVETYGSTPIEVVEWFLDFASRHNMAFYDPQSEKISARDRATFDAYCAALQSQAKAEQAADDRIRWQREFPDLQAKAAAGDVAALTELGNRYSFGEGTVKNAEMAFRCYSEAAEKGNADAMFNLAACYRRGEGVAADIQTALNWYEKASASGDLFAPFAIGEIFAKGESLPPDKAKATEYFKVALERGHPEARKALNDLNTI